MNKTSELNPMRVATIAIVAIALLGVIVVGANGESDSRDVSPEAVTAPLEQAQTPAAEPAPPVSEQSPEDFESWVSEAETDEQPADEDRSDSSGEDNGAAQATPETVAE